MVRCCRNVTEALRLQPANWSCFGSTSCRLGLEVVGIGICNRVAANDAWHRMALGCSALKSHFCVLSSGGWELRVQGPGSGDSGIWDPGCGMWGLGSGFWGLWSWGRKVGNFLKKCAHVFQRVYNFTDFLVKIFLQDFG